MQQRDFEQALKAMREKSKQRRFVQSVELIVNFKGLDPKKPDHQVDTKVNLPFAAGKKAGGKSLLFARDKNFISQMKEKVDRIVEEDAISKINRKEADAIANDFDVLIAEGPVTLTVAKFLGQQLAPKGKMPRPVQPDPAAAESIIKQLGSFTRVTNKKGKVAPLVQTVIGNEKMPEQELAANASAIVSAILAQLPRKEQNIKSVFVKLTMGPPFRIGAKEAGQ